MEKEEALREHSVTAERLGKAMLEVRRGEERLGDEIQAHKDTVNESKKELKEVADAAAAGRGALTEMVCDPHCDRRTVLPHAYVWVQYGRVCAICFIWLLRCYNSHYLMNKFVFHQTIFAAHYV